MYRVQQGLHALLAFSRPVDEALAKQYLSPAQMTLFQSMQRSEQLHSLNVLRSVLAQAPETPHALAVAALLHDVGKSRYPLAVWQKTFAVLVRAANGSLAKRLSDGDARNILVRPFVVSAHHPAWSAEMLRPTNPSETALWLVEHHADDLHLWDDHADVALLKRLKAADDLN